MIATFMVVSGWLFWAVVLLFLCLEVLLTEREKPGEALVVFVALVALVTLFSDVDPIGFVLQNWLLALLAVPVYFVAGTAWAWWKWKGVIADALATLSEKGPQWRKQWENNRRGEETFALFVQSRYDLPPRTVRNKERIINWIAFWPFSVFWYLLTYPRRVAKFIYQKVITAFENMVARAFAGKFE